jgi:hypothetical protein
MEVRAVRRHAMFALGLALLVVTSVNFMRGGPEVGLRNSEHIMIAAALILAMYGHFYTSGPWRRACEAIGVGLIAVAVAVRVFL